MAMPETTTKPPRRVVSQWGGVYIQRISYHRAYAERLTSSSVIGSSD